MKLRPTICIVLVIVLASSLLAQAPRKKKKIKDFGSSLKTLKWDPIKKAAVDSLRTAVNSTTNDEDVVRISTALVTCDVLVLDKHGNNVPGLTAADFIIAEDNQPQKVEHFVLGNSTTLPRTIVLILDYSGSQTPYLKTSIAAAKVLIDKLGPYDQMAIVTDDVEMVEDFTTDKKRLKKQLDALVERTQYKTKFFGMMSSGGRVGRSSQYSALMATLREAFDDQDLRPIVVLQSDGDELLVLRNSPIVPKSPPGLPIDLLLEDERTQELLRQYQRLNVKDFSIDDLYRTVEGSPATIYTIVPGFRMTGLTPDEQVKQNKADDLLRLEQDKELMDEEQFAMRKAQMEDHWKRTPVDAVKFRTAERAKYQSALAEIAPLTGGWTEFLETPAQAPTIYDRIFSDINQRYIVGYYPTNKESDGKRRTITFAVKDHPDYQILGRRSYFAPTQ